MLLPSGAATPAPLAERSNLRGGLRGGRASEGPAGGRRKPSGRGGSGGRRQARKHWQHLVPCTEEELCSVYSDDARMVAAYLGKGKTNYGQQSLPS
eukprot:scaffold2832_cov26-Prasinocladus_malaysianus.AAC.1